MPAVRRHYEKTVIVFLLKRAKNDIKRELRRYPEMETGGVLLGCRLGAVLLVLAATSSGEKSLHERCRFEMDMEHAVSAANAIIEEYRALNCRVVGIWHNHNNDCRIFSYDDIQTNSAYARLNSFGVVSVLVTKENGEDILNCFHIKPDSHKSELKLSIKIR